jgi:biotin carboxylase
MIAKLIVTAVDRPATVDRLGRALDAFEIEGLHTNLPLLRWIVRHDDFRKNRLSTGWLERTALPEFNAG